MLNKNKTIKQPLNTNAKQPLGAKQPLNAKQTIGAKQPLNGKSESFANSKTPFKGNVSKDKNYKNRDESSKW
jgi:hypothetical protein